MQFFSTNMKTLLLIFAWIFVARTVIAAEAQNSDPTWTRERMSDIVERAKTDPDALWELKDAPLKLVYQDLTEVWMNHAGVVDSRLSMKKQGREAVYLKAQAAFGLDPEYSAKVFPIARDVMLAHPDYEAYLSGKLQHLSEVLLRAESDDDYRFRSPEYGGANSDYTVYLDVAYRTPGDMAFRMIGPGILGADYPERDYGDYRIYSPASHARGRLARLAKERYGEDIPEDIEAARQWWRANEHRFAAKPPPQPPSPTAPMPRTSTLATPTLTDAPTTKGSGSPNARFLTGLMAGIAALLALALFASRRKS